MRVLLINPGYQPNFWSFEGILKKLGKKVIQPPLGLITLAALLPRSWSFRLVEEFARPVSERDLAWAQVVMVTGISTQHDRMLANLGRARAAGKLTVAGGPLAFHIPRTMLEAGADLVVKGEAEPVAADLVAAIEQGRRGLALESARRPDLGDSPLPRFDLLDLDLYLDMAVQFSRGCPHACDFCDVTLMLGRRMRCKTPERFLAELQALHDLGWRRNVFVVDDNFVGDRSQARDLLLALIPWMEAKGFPYDFMTQVSLDLARDPELARLMARAGFNRVFIGVETTDRPSLALVGKRHNLALDPDLACRVISQAGLMIMAACMLGFDGEEPGAGGRFLDFARRNRIPDVFATLLHAVPGTALHRRLQAEGRLLPMRWDGSMGSQASLSNFVTTRPRGELARELSDLLVEAYQPGEYAERLADHLAAMPPWNPAQARRRPHWREVWAVLGAAVRCGLAPEGGRRFWRQAGRGLLRFPSRMRQFWAACLLAEHGRRYALGVRRELERLLELDQEQGLDAPHTGVVTWGSADQGAPKR